MEKPKEIENPLAVNNDRLKVQKLKEQLYSEQGYYRKLSDKIAITKAYKRPNKDNSDTCYKFKSLSSKETRRFEQNQFILQTNYVTTQRHSSLKDLETLKPILIKDMQVNKIHLDYYLECITIENPFYISGLNLLIKDLNGDIEHLVLYNYETKSLNNTDPKYLFPIGTQLIIKEPHLQLLGLEENDFGIRIDSPTNLIIKSFPNIDKSIDELIDDGNKSFSRSQFYQAIRYYSQAINKSNNKSVRAFLNRSQAFIKIEKFNSAYEDAKHAASLETNNEKAYFRMGKSAYLMRKFNLALENYQKCVQLNPQNKEVQEEIKKTQNRLNEAETGVYDLNRIYEQFFKRDELFMDVAEYRSDKIKVTDIPNKCKGVVACELIKKGTLIVLSKAASAIFHTKLDYRRKSYNTVKCQQRMYNTKNESENIADLVYKMQDNPDLSSDIYSLFGGVEYTRDKLNQIIDIKRIENIYAFNSFQIKNFYETLEIIEMENEIKEIQIYDEEDFMELDLASLNFESSVYSKLAQFQVKYNNLNKQCGLWYFVAYFNHSCLSNCLINTVGDVLMIYTQRDIEKDEELTIRYFPPEWSYDDKIERATNIYGFKCDCTLCQLDEKDPMRPKRDQLLTEIESKNENKKYSITELLADIQKVRNTYSNRPKWHLQLLGPLEILAQKYRSNFNYKKSAKCYEDIFELIKDYNDYVAINMIKEAYLDYKKCSETKADACKKTAFEYFISINYNSIYYEKLWNKMTNLF